MLKRGIFILIACIVLYTGLVQLQVSMGKHHAGQQANSSQSGDPKHKVYFFSFSKYTQNGDKEIEIEGDSANILARTVELINVMAKAYAQESPVTITSDEGYYDKVDNKVHLQKNVVATTEDGARLLTEELDILPGTKVMQTDVQAQVKKDNIDISGLGAKGDSRVKKVKFNKNVTVVVQDPNQKEAKGPTTITCDGPLVVDYENNIAHFKDNVITEDSRGKLRADRMDVYYDKTKRRIFKIIAIGNVVIENPNGDKTYSDHVIYMAEDGRIILGGDSEAVYFGDDKDKSTTIEEKEFF